MKKYLLFSLVCILGFGQSLKGQEQTPFYTLNNIEQINISFEQENWKYLLDSLRFNGDGLLLANCEINGHKYMEVGVGYRGTRSFQPGSRRNGLVIQLNFINQSQNHEGYQLLDLSSAIRDPSMVREVMFYDVARNYMPAPQANYAKVNINDAYYGLFVNIEAVDKIFVEKHFGSSDGSFFKSAPNVGKNPKDGCYNNVYGSLRMDNGAKCYLDHFNMLSESGWDDLINLTKVLNENPEQIGKVLNVDRTLWMLALNNAMVNLESYTGQFSQNYFLYQDEKGQFNPIIWEVNLAFGSFKNTGDGSDLDLEQMQSMDPLLHLDNETKPLISQLLSDPLNQKIYLSHIRSIIYEHFYSGDYEIKAKELQDMIRDAFNEDPNKKYTINDFEQSFTTTVGRRSKIPGIEELMKERSSFLRKTPVLAIIPPQVSEVSVLPRGEFSSESLQEFNIQAKVEKYPKTVKVMYRFDTGADFQEAQMFDNGKSNDGKARDQIYGVTIKPPFGKQNIEYYIFTENAKAVSFDPPNYMYNLHTSSLSELNK